MPGKDGWRKTAITFTTVSPFVRRTWTAENNHHVHDGATNRLGKWPPRPRWCRQLACEHGRRKIATASTTVLPFVPRTWTAENDHRLQDDAANRLANMGGGRRQPRPRQRRRSPGKRGRRKTTTTSTTLPPIDLRTWAAEDGNHIHDGAANRLASMGGGKWPPRLRRCRHSFDERGRRKTTTAFTAVPPIAWRVWAAENRDCIHRCAANRLVSMGGGKRQPRSRRCRQSPREHGRWKTAARVMVTALSSHNTIEQQHTVWYVLK